MDRGRGLASEILIRTAVTLLVLGGLAGLLLLSEYDFDFGALGKYWAVFPQGILLTLAVTAVAYVAGLAGGVVVAQLRRARSLPLRHLGDMYVEFFRGTPFLCQLFLAYFGIAPLLGIDSKFAVGAAAMALYASAYSGEIIRAGIESIERGQVEAARSLGLGRWQTLRHVVLPQAFKRMIPPLTGELIAMVKDSALLFTIGMVELLAVAKQAGADTYRYFEAFLLACAIYLVINIPLSQLSQFLERRLQTTQRPGGHL